ncbi:acyltransferase ChoActase/COT/CPT [Metschnikowia bicuspidata var. bicuspidata NRRL YB-4993]|uniref:Carnitine O-acetyltransferase, mitochondrial n=1 Tax=Metschnikowia bicuspidata var. bicuspidata NRRL YB-4993 TaxID=869754 RepID=A0A1A0HG17_9ASCO|nr:acyltransferase ChoActase/COT/CPT [Metschnikowia bicuspidata var. bicuspidata NRRL YB-4993]OBA23104.1 acyltransferase ChoActase/COT/CPT [Metschnikowia bicuspidata var. bicuspidata NRRL YB-4993]
MLKSVARMTRTFSSSAARGDLFKYQGALPHLPVPPLADTCAKYIKTVEPYLSESQLVSTKAVVAEFARPGGKGEALQQRLEAFAAGKDNWLAEFWDDYAYMSYRDPVVPYVSYFFSHKDVNNPLGKNQLYKASLLAYYTTQFLLDVETETLDPEVIKGNPYCMNAFRFMFNNSRVPAAGSDITKTYSGKDHRYFVVALNNNFYKVFHHGADGQPLSKAAIYHQLLHLTTAVNPRVPRGEGVGALTSLNRDEYLSAYEHLVKSPVNAASLESIFASSFVICLDDNYPVTIEEKSRNCWHGDGQNRWFDKPLEFFVSKNGNSGFLGEHSRMDATPTVQLNNRILQQIAAEDPASFVAEITALGAAPAEAVPQGPSLLPFDLSMQAKTDIKNAKEKFNATIAALDHEVFQYYGYGKNLIKQFKVSPDAYVQMLMQLAYYKLTGVVRPTYESAATRKYLKGRTETGRVVSNESKAFVETFTNDLVLNEAKIAAFNAACKQHVKYLGEAADGKGVDRHLFGLLQMLSEGEDVPEIFKDPVFKHSSTWYVSTSQVPSEHFQSWGWSQVIDEGFGLAYLVNSEWLHVNISSKKGYGLNSAHLKYYLVEAANEMKQVLSTQLAPKAKL